MFLEECKYIVKEEKVIRYITDEQEIFSDDFDKKILINKIKKDSWV